MSLKEHLRAVAAPLVLAAAGALASPHEAQAQDEATTQAPDTSPEAVQAAQAATADIAAAALNQELKNPFSNSPAPVKMPLSGLEAAQPAPTPATAPQMVTPEMIKNIADLDTLTRRQRTEIKDLKEENAALVTESLSAIQQKGRSDRKILTLEEKLESEQAIIAALKGAIAAAGKEKGANQEKIEELRAIMESKEKSSEETISELRVALGIIGAAGIAALLVAIVALGRKKKEDDLENLQATGAELSVDLGYMSRLAAEAERLDKIAAEGATSQANNQLDPTSPEEPSLEALAAEFGVHLSTGSQESGDTENKPDVTLSCSPDFSSASGRKFFADYMSGCHFTVENQGNGKIQITVKDTVTPLHGAIIVKLNGKEIDRTQVVGKNGTMGANYALSKETQAAIDEGANLEFIFEGSREKAPELEAPTEQPAVTEPEVAVEQPVVEPSGEPQDEIGRDQVEEVTEVLEATNLAIAEQSQQEPAAVASETAEIVQEPEAPIELPDMAAFVAILQDVVPAQWPQEVTVLWEEYSKPECRPAVKHFIKQAMQGYKFAELKRQNLESGMPQSQRSPSLPPISRPLQKILDDSIPLGELGNRVREALNAARKKEEEVRETA